MHNTGKSEYATIEYTTIIVQLRFIYKQHDTKLKY